jgi:hypothetical protein
VKLYRKDFIEKRYRDWLKALLTVFLIHCHSSVIRSNFTRKYFFKLWNLFNPGLSPSHLYCQSTFWQFLRIRCCNSAKTTLCSCKVDGSPQWLQNFASNLTIVIIGRKREQGTCMTRKKQSFGSIRSNWWFTSSSFLIAYITPCQSGFSTSLLVSATVIDRSNF